MHFYRALLQDVSDLKPTDTHHAATLADARTQAKHWAPRAAVRIELIDVPTDKAGVLELLRGYSLDDFQPVRTWALTPRGGLREIANGE